jgi:hypothetical protein
VQATGVITGSLCAQEFNKVQNIQIAKVIWDTLKEAHEGTEHVRQEKMDLINGELELFFMKYGETIREMYDRLMLLVSDIRALRRQDWDDFKVTKKLLRACDAPGFQLRIIDTNDLDNPVKRVDFGQIWVNLGHHLETLATITNDQLMVNFGSSLVNFCQTLAKTL